MAPNRPSTQNNDGKSYFDRVLDALSDPRRRRLLYFLREEEATELDEAAKAIAAKEEECEPDSVSDSIFEDVQTSLYHIHLPKLRDSGIIEYDRRSGSIRLDDPHEELELLLDVGRSFDDEDYQFTRGPTL